MVTMSPLLICCLEYLTHAVSMGNSEYVIMCPHTHTHTHTHTQCDADPDVSKVAVEEDKYENVLTLITYYQMVRLQMNWRRMVVWGV